MTNLKIQSQIAQSLEDITKYLQLLNIRVNSGESILLHEEIGSD